MQLHEFPVRFTSKLRELDSGCWEWQAARNKAGYGYFGYGGGTGRLTYAHRWAYWFVHGWWSTRAEPLDHFRFPDAGCIGPSCVNPAHVRRTSARENTLRGDTLQSRNRAKTHCDNGHEFTPESTWFDQNGCRQCLTCRRLRQGYTGQQPNGAKERCKRGHPLSGENLYIRPDRVGRDCKTCRRERSQAANARKPKRRIPGQCSQGHRWADGHEAITPLGRRYCRTCQKARNAARARRRRATT